MVLEVVTKNELWELKEMLHEILERLPKCPTVSKKEYLTAKEVKEILQCSDNTLSNYRKNGMLSAKKVGGRFYYCQTDLGKLLSLKSGGYNEK